jgi:hypothetical protein
VFKIYWLEVLKAACSYTFGVKLLVSDSVYIVRLLDCVRVFISALWIIHWNTGLYYLCPRSCIRNVVCWTIILTVGGITMVNKCAAFGCKSGYKNNVQQDTDIKITYHSFPLDSEELCDKLQAE